MALIAVSPELIVSEAMPDKAIGRIKSWGFDKLSLNEILRE